MAKKLETASINDVIKTLTNLKKELTAKGVKNAGNIPVMLSSDEEGNYFGTLQFTNNHATSLGYDEDTDYGKVVTLYPYEEYIELYSF